MPRGTSPAPPPPRGSRASSRTHASPPAIVSRSPSTRRGSTSSTPTRGTRSAKPASRPPWPFRPGGRRGAARLVLRVVSRAPHLYECLRAFCLGAFAAERGAQVPFAFEEHATRQGPSLYEYRPLVRGFVDEQAPTLRRLPDARNAIEDLKREPAAAIFARAHAGFAQTPDDALFRSILLPMLTWTAERCGGFDWNDEAFDTAYGDFELSLFG